MTISRILPGKARNVDGLPVSRVLPDAHLRAVGPFVFFDHLGPTTLEPGRAIDVRPHPHIHLATVTYVFEGEILHRDSLGTEQVIGPLAINLMIAGTGIVHSERTPEALRKTGSPLHALQIWVALPMSHEDIAPAFHHHSATSLPERTIDGVRVRVLMGALFGETSPVLTYSRLVYVEFAMPKGTSIPLPADHEERAIYVVTGGVRCDDTELSHGHMAALVAGSVPTLTAEEDTHVVMIGGDPLDAPRFMDWNFVSSSHARVEQAKADWREGRFPKVPGDDVEFIPLP